MTQTLPTESGTVMYRVGAVVLACVAIYFLFTAVNTLGLAEESGTGVVVGKAYREAGTTYHTQVIDGRSYVRPQATPDMYLLDLTIDEKSVQAEVERALFDDVEQGEQVEVVYRQHRLTGGTQVVRVSR